jgi:hypothetical protein
LLQNVSNFAARCRVALKSHRPWVNPLSRSGVFSRFAFHWICLARPNRVAVIYYTDQPVRLQRNLRSIAGWGEIVVTSHAVNRRLGSGVQTLESPIGSPGAPASIGHWSGHSPSVACVATTKRSVTPKP